MHLEINFLSKIVKNLEDKLKKHHYLEEALKGAHIRFDDNGSLYNYLIKEYQKNIQKRYSSHLSCVKQYSFSGFVIKEAIFGVFQDPESGKKMTWVQFERNNTKTIINFILHMCDYIIYKLSGKNIGPYGSSLHTDKNPLVINPLITK